jgi:carboxymethylenebutenolidase
VPTGSPIEFATTDARLPGWLARPDAPGPWTGLVLVPDVHGLSDHYRDIATRYAAAGYLTLAVDLYGREGAPRLADAAAAIAWIRDLPDGRVLDDLVAARAHLATQAGARPDAIGVTGHCMGGQYAILAACRDRGWAACVAWYGMLRYAHYDARNPASPLDRAAHLGCPLLGLYGEADALIPLADVEAFRAAAAGRPVELYTYPGAGHAFFNDTRPDAYRPVAAADGWKRALAFLARHLDGAAGPRQR